MRLVSLVAGFGLVCLCAAARVGESRQQCDARYGEPVRVNEAESLVTYKSRGFSVVVHFSSGSNGGRADMLSFQKLPSASGKPASLLTEKEIEEILRANGGELVWVEGPEHERWRTWRTDDGAMLAVLDRRADYLMVYVKGFVPSETAARVSGHAPLEPAAGGPRRGGSPAGCPA